MATRDRIWDWMVEEKIGGWWLRYVVRHKKDQHSFRMIFPGHLIFYLLYFPLINAAWFMQRSRCYLFGCRIEQYGRDVWDDEEWCGRCGAGWALGHPVTRHAICIEVHPFIRWVFFHLFRWDLTDGEL